MGVFTSKDATVVQNRNSDASIHRSQSQRSASGTTLVIQQNQGATSVSQQNQGTTSGSQQSPVRDEGGTVTQVYQRAQNSKVPGKQSSPSKSVRTFTNKRSVPSSLENTLMEHVFLITLDTGRSEEEEGPPYCLYLKEMAGKLSKHPLLDTETIQQALYWRLLMNTSGDLEKNVIGSMDLPASSERHYKAAIESSTFLYLYQCYERFVLQSSSPMFQKLTEELLKCRELILSKTQTCLRRPELYPKQKIFEQLLDLCYSQKESLIDKQNPVQKFLLTVLTAVEEFSKDTLAEVLTPVLNQIHQKFAKEYKLSSPEVPGYLCVLKFFTLKPSLAMVFIDHSIPKDWAKARSYEDTLIGSILSFTCSPKSNKGPYEFFVNSLGASRQDNENTMKYIWQHMTMICDNLYWILYTIITKTEELRHKVLWWIGKCLHANSVKPYLWSAHEAQIFNQDYCTDGFCLNLCYLMLKLCYPFAKPSCDKLLKVCPSYTKVVIESEQDAQEKWVHAQGLSMEPTFVQSKDTSESLLPQKPAYHFISECFYLCQQAFHQGFSMIPKLIKLSRSVHNLNKLYKEIKDNYPFEVVEPVREQINKELCWYLNMKAAIFEPHLLWMSIDFHVATATWLVQVARRDDLKKFDPVTFPFPSEVPKSLCYVPEFVMSNITTYLLSLAHLNEGILESHIDNMNHLMTLILVYMGSSERLGNSDMRAKLAESLETFLPHSDSGKNTSLSSSIKERVFHEHPHIEHLAETLLHVFVSIEMRGQSVDSEMKFNYRKSMHRVLQYICDIPLHRKALKRLARTAEKQIDDTDPPLFLRFINLLINDAIFLLDDALDHMKQIREKEQERERGDWSKLTAKQLRERESGLQHLGLMGRHRNILANHTIYTMEIITREIRAIFCHDIMVDRIAGMLNYFLKHLVGPEQKQYKVKDKKELEFKPEQIVSDIAHIYCYLGTSDSFCRAVIGESRSFSPELFTQASSVLRKIGKSEEFLARFEDLTNKIQSVKAVQKQDEDLAAEAPEEFLDPIMGTLMIEPVTLPTSNTTVDKAVIARHLLRYCCLLKHLQC